MQYTEDRLQPRNRRGLPPLVVVFGVGGILVAAAAVISYVVGADLVLFKVGEESNIPTWFSSVQLFTIGAVLSVIAYRDITTRRPKTFMLVSVPFLFFFLSLDEIAMIHERLGAWLQTLGVGTGLRTGPWMFIFVPLVGIIALIAAWAFWPYLRRSRFALGLGLAGFVILGFSAAGLEVVANFVPEGSLWQQGLGFAEEYGEMFAATVILWSALVVVHNEGIRLELGERTTAPSARRNATIPGIDESD